MLKIRSGIGYDIHRLTKGNGLFLGGIKISDEFKFEAHSDGDVLIHALIDSLLGAIGERDIGELFPDSDDKYKSIRSTLLLAQVVQLYKQKNYEIVNIDCVVLVEKPIISPFKYDIKTNIANILGISPDDFNLKTKTKEKIGAVGRGEAMECYCISMVRSQ